MGRNSRTDEPNTTSGYSGQTSAAESDLASQYTTPSTATASKPVTDSENMARDIKEGRLSGFVGHGTVLTGETSFQMMLRVDGNLVGSVSSETGTLIVGTNGQVDANVAVGTAMVNGVVNGDIIASEKIHLGRTARVIGNIEAPRLIIEEGALLEGGCKMVKALEKQAEEQASASTAATSSSTGYGYEQKAAAATTSYASSTTTSASDDTDSDNDDDDDDSDDD
jgi:cytoskeletal protein CcmA (bactofilin family)